MNSHLNLFRFFNENTGEEFLENNLSRAFAICLVNDSLFLNEYLQAILTAEDFQYLFSYISMDTTCLVNLQVDTATIDKEDFRTVYAVAMTAQRNLNMADFMEQPDNRGERNITDIFLAIKDIAILIEVKRNHEDCKAQLFSQIRPFLAAEANGTRFVIHPKSYSWPEVLQIMERVKHLQQISGRHTVFIQDFIELSQQRYPQWFEPKPFYVIPFSAKVGSPIYLQLENRMRQALAGVALAAGDKYTLLPYADRLGICLPFSWASELIPQFATYPDDPVDYIVFNIWPANTKGQGYSIYSKSLDWVDKKVITISGKECTLEIAYEIKLSHFNRYISSIYYTNDALIETTHTADNFYNVSGKYQRSIWEQLEQFFDSHFKSDFDWRKNCEWEKKFLNSDRSYLTMSLGFTVHAFVPFSELRDIDRRDENVTNVTAYLIQVIEAFSHLIDQ